MTQEDYDVVIAGAGPVGLLLSCELARTGLSVIILEQDPEAGANWKAAPMGLRGLNTPSIELLYRRGLMDDVLGNNRTQSTFKKTEGYQSGWSLRRCTQPRLDIGFHYQTGEIQLWHSHISSKSYTT